MVFGRVPRLPCDLMFGAPPDRAQSTTDYTADLVERLHDIHPARQHLKVASDRMKARYDQLANSAGYQEGESVAVTSYPEERRSLKLQSYWEGTYNINRINDVIYGIQRHPRAKMMVVHLDTLAPYLGAIRDE